MPPVAEQKITVNLTRPIVLVGLMGAGKTSVGKRLASFLDVPFHDSDEEIERAAGMEVREIFEEFGEPYFRDREAMVIARLLGGPPGILATGGGAYLTPSTREAIHEAGCAVWLDADLDTLWHRVKDRGTRPLLQTENPKEVLSGLLEARAPVYAKAEVHVKSEHGQTHEDMVKKILLAVRARDVAHPENPPVLEKKIAE